MRLIDADALMQNIPSEEIIAKMAVAHAPTIDIVFCKECKHRPKLSDENGERYGFNVEEVSERCPCVCEDGWYSWMPPDDFYCGYGERKE